MADRARRIELYLLRHADAGDPLVWAGADAERPLSAKGRRQAERLGRHLAGLGFQPDAILTSPKVRATETAQIVASLLDRPVRVDERLAGPLDPDTIEGILRDAGDPRRPVLVGHDPDFSELVSALSGLRDPAMKKGALARIDVERPLGSEAGTLRWLIPPDAVPDGSPAPDA